MTRRTWLAAPAAGIFALGAVSLRPKRSLMEMTPGMEPLTTGSHIGFLPGSRKRIFLRTGESGQAVKLAVNGSNGFRRMFPVGNREPSAFDSASRTVLLNALNIAGSYRAQMLVDDAPAGNPLAFSVAPDVWRGVLPLLAGYAHRQRCGHSDRTVHPICHLDDARRRDTGAHVDVTGGWHDAGDVRKWVDSTIMNLLGLAALARNPAVVQSGGPLSMRTLLDEARFGNAFFLKMQDSDGLVWADVGGGVNGNNSDNRWTDNKTGTPDDRWINTEKKPGIQAMFVAAQAIMSQLFSDVDAAYGATCLDAGLRCWKASSQPIDNTSDLAWRTLAAAELFRATGSPGFVHDVVALASQLAGQQITKPLGSGTTVRGFFPMWIGSQQPLRNTVHSAIPAIALLTAAHALGARCPVEARKWNTAVRLYLEEYAVPMADFSPYGIVPFGLFLDTPSADQDLERYRPLSPRYSYRFFMPVRSKAGYLGLNSHLLSHALLFGMAGRSFGESKYRDLAFSHLEWVFGANPFGASLVSGIGSGQPPAFSPFVGGIPGGIMNGVAGNEQDQPVLDQSSSAEWRTNEYWSPHSGYCLWTLSVLESA